MQPWSRRRQASAGGTKRIAAELGCSRNTLRRWLSLGGWQRYGRPRRRRALDGVEGWLEERFHRHAGNADVVHQELAAAARATVCFEMPPGQQGQIDFGERRVEITGEMVRVHLFVATLGYSLRRYVQAFWHERQACRLAGSRARSRTSAG
jgi:transposase